VGPGKVQTGAENLAPTGIRFPDRPSEKRTPLSLPINMFFAVHTIKAYGGLGWGRYSCTHPKPGNRWSRAVSLMLRPLYLPVKRARYSLNIRLSGPHSRSGCCQTPLKDKLPNHFAVNKPATKITERRWKLLAMGIRVNFMCEQRVRRHALQIYRTNKRSFHDD
jgi:hypothetical protein